jgi:hypothetical protein
MEVKTNSYARLLLFGEDEANAHVLEDAQAN